MIKPTFYCTIAGGLPQAQRPRKNRPVAKKAHTCSATAGENNMAVWLTPMTM
jgi:hypothetical protein